MDPTKGALTSRRQWLLRNYGFAALVLLLAAFFLALGVYRFYTHVNHIGPMDILGCLGGAVGGFFLLIITDYLLHHARLVFYLWATLLAGFASIEPHLGIGLGLAFGYILILQLRD